MNQLEYGAYYGPRDMLLTDDNASSSSWGCARCWQRLSNIVCSDSTCSVKVHPIILQTIRICGIANAIFLILLGMIGVHAAYTVRYFLMSLQPRFAWVSLMHLCTVEVSSWPTHSLHSTSLVLSLFPSYHTTPLHFTSGSVRCSV